MKKTLLFAAFLLAALGAFAQSYFRNPTGDTVVGRDTTYFYGQWYDTFDPSIDWDFCPEMYGGYSTRLAALRFYPSSYLDFTHNAHRDSTSGFPYLVNGVRHVTARQFYTSRPLSVIGLAAACEGLPAAGFYGYTTDSQMHDYIPAIDLDPANRLPEYLQLYDVNGDAPIMLQQESWSMLDSHRYMNPLLGISHVATRPLYEVYFDKEMVVEGHFAVGLTHDNNTMAFVHNDTEGLWKYEHVTTEEIVIDGGPLRDTIWVQLENRPFLRFSPPAIFCIFPILDTGYVPPHVECPIVTDLDTRPIDESSLWIVWPDNPDHSRWQAVIGPVGTDPDSAQPRTSYAHYIRANDLVPDSQYVAYVRGWCDRDSSWGAWSNCLRFSLNDSSANDSLDITSPQNLVDRFTSIFPNPAHGQATVYSSFGLRSLSAFSLDGREMMRMPASGLSASFSTDHWPAGSYILQIRTPRGTAVKTLLVR